MTRDHGQRLRPLRRRVERSRPRLLHPRVQFVVDERPLAATTIGRPRGVQLGDVGVAGLGQVAGDGPHDRGVLGHPTRATGHGPDRQFTRRTGHRGLRSWNTILLGVTARLGHSGVGEQVDSSTPEMIGEWLGRIIDCQYSVWW